MNARMHTWWQKDFSIELEAGLLYLYGVIY